MNMYKKIERKKYKGLKLPLIMILFTLVNIALAAMSMFSSSFTDEMNTSGYAWLLIMDSYLLYTVLISPIFLAMLTSRSVELENHGNMWKVLRVCGVELNEIYTSKFAYIFKFYLFYQVINWLAQFLMAKYVGLTETIPYFRFAIVFLSQIAITFMIMSFHYVLSLRWSNQLISISVSLLGTILGFVSLLLPRIVSDLIPYSWYGALAGMGTEFVRKGVWNRFELPINYRPLILSLIIGIIIYSYGKKKFMEVKEA